MHLTRRILTCYWLTWMHIRRVKSSWLHAGSLRPAYQIVYNSLRCRRLVAAHEMARARDNLQSARRQALDPRLQLVARRHLIILTSDEELGAVENAKLSRQTKDRRTDGDDRFDPWIMRRIDQRDIRAKRMSHQAELVAVGSRLGQGKLHRASDIQWLQAPIGLLPFACAYPAKIEAQRDETRSGEISGKLDGERVVHRAGQRLGMAKRHDRQALEIAAPPHARAGNDTLQLDGWARSAGEGDSPLQYV